MKSIVVPLVALFMWLGVGVTLVTFAEEFRPNIIILLSDDMGWGMTGLNSGGVIKTPHLDTMAGNGVHFTQFYAAYPNCAPTRASVLTGRHPLRMGINSIGKRLPEAELTLAEILQQNGYHTAHFGKWHLQGPSKSIPIKGFERKGKGPTNNPMQLHMKHPGVHGFKTWLTSTNYNDLDPAFGNQDGVVKTFKGDSSDVLIAETLRFIEQSANHKVPFFAFVCYGSPHDRPFKSLPEDYAVHKNHVLGEVVGMDRSVGTLREGLRKLGIEKDTLILFCSDNGANGGMFEGTPYAEVYNGNFRGSKSTIWEAGIRSPGILEWPGRIEAGQVVDLPASTMDILPTLAGILNIEIPAGPGPLDGIDIWPYLRGEKTEPRPPIPFWNLIKNPNRLMKQGGHAALVDGKWKLHINPSNTRMTAEPLQASMLFDLEADPGETTNVADQHPELVKRLQSMLKDWQIDVGNDPGRSKP